MTEFPYLIRNRTLTSGRPIAQRMQQPGDSEMYEQGIVGDGSGRSPSTKNRKPRDYEELQWRTHRRQVAIVEAPAIAWHRVYWRRADDPTCLDEKAWISARIVEILDRLDCPKTPSGGILKLFDGSTYDCSSRERRPNEQQSPDILTPDTVNFRGLVGNAKIRCRVGIYNENWIFTAYLEIHSCGNPAKTKQSNSSPREPVDRPVAGGEHTTDTTANRSVDEKYFRDFYQSFEQIGDKLRRSYAKRLCAAFESEEDRKHLLDQERQLFEDDIDRIYYETWAQIAKLLAMDLTEFDEKKIADFRGLVLLDSSKEVPNDAGDSARPRLSAQPHSDIPPRFRGRTARRWAAASGFSAQAANDASIAGQPAATATPELFSSATRDQHYGIRSPSSQKYGENSYPLINYLWPFITAPRSRGLPPDGIQHGKMKSHEFTCSRLLGGNAIYCSTLGARGELTESLDEPIIYIVITKSTSRWQVGRLLDRLHHLGNLRLSALLDIGTLEAVSDTIKEIGLEIDKWWENGQHVEVDAKKLRNLELRLAQKTGEVRGGLAYRVERSRYYVRLFNILVKEMRIGRIEGFQNYAQFVRRRLSSDLFFIDSIGIRYERLQNRLHALNSQLRTDTISKSSLAIKEFQKAGELIAIFGLLPYYVYNILLHCCVELEWLVEEGNQHRANVHIFSADGNALIAWGLEHLQLTTAAILIPALYSKSLTRYFATLLSMKRLTRKQKLRLATIRRRGRYWTRVLYVILFATIGGGLLLWMLSGQR